MKRFLAINLNNEVVAQAVSRKDRTPDPIPGLTFVEVPEGISRQVHGRLFWDYGGTQQGNPRFTYVNGALLQVPDNRLQLELTIPEVSNGFADAAAQYTLNFQLKDNSGNNLNSTRRVPLAVLAGGERKTVSLSLVDGVASLIKQFPPGTVEITSARPDFFRVVGETVFYISEVWS